MNDSENKTLVASADSVPALGTNEQSLNHFQANDNRDRIRFFKPRIGSRRIRNRLVQKYGLCNISLVNVPKQRRKYFRSI